MQTQEELEVQLLQEVIDTKETWDVLKGLEPVWSSLFNKYQILQAIYLTSDFESANAVLESLEGAEEDGIELALFHTVSADWFYEHCKDSIYLDTELCNDLELSRYN